MNPRFLVLAFAAAAIPVAGRAQSPPEPPRPTVIVIRPSAEPVPALNYRLVTPKADMVPGNAAVFYHRAILMLSEALQSAQRREQPQGAPRNTPSFDLVFDWLSMPIADFPREKAREFLGHYANVLRELELGALRSTCDWEFDLRDEGFELLVPEIQQMRLLHRLVALRARLAIADGKIDEGIRWVRTGYTNARHTSRGPSAIQFLVGIACTANLSKVLEDLIQAPGAPNLYWALANRP